MYEKSKKTKHLSQIIPIFLIKMHYALFNALAYEKCFLNRKETEVINPHWAEWE